MTGPGEETVRLDSATLRAAFVYDTAVDVAQHAPVRRRRGNQGRRWPTGAERSALINTLGVAMREGLDLQALRSLMNRALAMDPGRPAYGAMREALGAFAPQAGFTCPQCQQTVPSGIQARAGWCTTCQKATGGEWYPNEQNEPSWQAAGRWPGRLNSRPI